MKSLKKYGFLIANHLEQSFLKELMRLPRRFVLPKDSQWGFSEISISEIDKEDGNMA